MSTDWGTIEVDKFPSIMYMYIHNEYGGVRICIEYGHTCMYVYTVCVGWFFRAKT